MTENDSEKDPRESVYRLYEKLLLVVPGSLLLATIVYYVNSFLRSGR